MDIVVTNKKGFVKKEYEEIKIYKYCIYIKRNNNIRLFNKKSSLFIIIGQSQYLEKKIESSTDSIKEIEYQKADGNFAVIIIKKEKITIVTDCSGSMPLYYGKINDYIAVSTKPEEVVKSLQIYKYDLVSIADYILNETICHPYTIYKYVYSVEAGSITTIASIIKINKYYSPKEERYKKSLDHYAEQLLYLVKNTINTAIENKKFVKVLFSGGEDARAVTSLIPSQIKCTLTTIQDSKNREYILAKKAANALGKPLEVVYRPGDFYRNNLSKKIHLIGSGRDCRHIHLFGETASAYQDADLLLGGYAADTLFKTAWMGNKTNPFFGLGPEKIGKSRPDMISGVYQPEQISWLDKDTVASVWERRWKHHLRIKEFRPNTAGNWHTLWPMGTQRVTYPHFLSTLRVGPKLVEPFLDNRLYQLAAEMPDEYRVDRKVFRRAFKGVLGKAAWIPGSNNRIPALGGYSSRITELGLIAYRKCVDKITGKAGEQTSFGKDHKGFLVDPNELPVDSDSSGFKEVLMNILQKQDPQFFWANEQIPDRAKVRALQMAYTFKNNLNK